MHCMGSLALRNVLRDLLDLDMLFVGEHALVVNEFESHPALAVVAELRLSDSTSLDELIFLLLALAAPVRGLLHLWHGVRSPDDDSL